jgi:TonB family protein
MIHDRETKTNLDVFMHTGWRLKTGAGHKTGRDKTGAYLPLSSSFVASAFVHVLVFFLTSTLISSRDNMLQNELIPITLVDIRQREQEAQSPNEEPPSPVRKPLAVPPKPEKFNKPLPPTKREALKLERSDPPPAPAMAKEDAKSIETKPILPAHRQQKTIFSSTATIEGGSEAAGGNLFDAGDAGAAPGSGITGEGAGTAAAGLGRGSGAPGSHTPLRTNREAKPLQTVRASYPPMALRLGLEGDVALRIEIDTEGKVTKADVIKSAGAAFDEEALKAVKQSRFEPARKDGLNVPAEFTYIYRFRLAK